MRSSKLNGIEKWNCFKNNLLEIIQAPISGSVRLSNHIPFHKNSSLLEVQQRSLHLKQEVSRLPYQSRLIIISLKALSR